MYWDGRSCRSHPSWLDLGHSTNKKMEKEINIKTARVEFKKGMYYPRLIIKLTTAPTGFVATYTCVDWPKGIFGQYGNGTYRPGVTRGGRVHRSGTARAVRFIYEGGVTKVFSDTLRLCLPCLSVGLFACLFQPSEQINFLNGAYRSLLGMYFPGLYFVRR